MRETLELFGSDRDGFQPPLCWTWQGIKTPLVWSREGFQLSYAWMWEGFEPLRTDAVEVWPSFGLDGARGFKLSFEQVNCE